MDRITDLPPSLSYDGNTYDSIFTFVCMLTKQAHFVRTNKTLTSEQLAHIFIDHIFSKHGLPKVIVSDRDTLITSDFWKSLFSAKGLGSTLNLSTAYHPQTDGQSEITHRTIEQILRAFVSPQHDDWSTWLPIAEFAYNSHVHTSTGQTPFFSNFGFHPTAPSSLLRPDNPDAADYLDTLRDIQITISRELELAKARQAEYANLHRRPLSFSVGDRVRLSSEHITLSDYPSPKFRPRFLGPFSITHIVSPVSYRLALPASMSRIHPVFHVSRLLPWTDNSDAEFPSRNVPDQIISDARDFVYGDNAYEVASISDCKIDTDPQSRARPKAPCLFFFVRWAPPFDSSNHDSWEPMRSLTKLDAFRTFLRSPAWHAFSSSDAYKLFAHKFKSKIPKVVHFSDDA